MGLIANLTVCLEAMVSMQGTSTSIVFLIVFALVSFGVAFVWLTGSVARRPRTVVALLIWQSLLATFVDTDLGYVLALMLPFIYTRRTASIWLVARNVVALPYFFYLAGTQLPADATLGTHVMAVAPHLMWQVFSFAIGLIAVTERKARAELERTQHLLADRSRLEERVEIARELHDSLGHHLVVLNVQLELGRHLATGRALDAIVQAQATGKQLLGELRSVVSAWRTEALDLPAALEAIARAIETPAIVVTIADPRTIEPAIARALFRCAQELVTNAVRHADAGHVWLELLHREGGVSLVTRDDGRGQATIVPGNGLRGLQERVDALHGRVEISSIPEQGFRVEIWLPS